STNQTPALISSLPISELGLRQASSLAELDGCHRRHTHMAVLIGGRGERGRRTITATDAA
ncbi:hypothetical protein XENORESO_008272, partial [Xenotaenia resolanae]